MNKKNLILIISTTLILLVSIITAIYVVNKDDKQKEEPNQVKKIDEMQIYDYYLEENATDYYKQLYNELKEILTKEEINEEEYTKKISQLFVTDLFTLDNKITSSDIGGLQFIYTEFKEDFINIAKTTLYSSVESNIYGDRKQELPIVTNTTIKNIEQSKFTYKDKEYDSYEVILTIEYQKDLDYPTEYHLTLINNEKYIQVVAAE